MLPDLVEPPVIGVTLAAGGGVVGAVEMKALCVDIIGGVPVYVVAEEVGTPSTVCRTDSAKSISSVIPLRSVDHVIPWPRPERGRTGQLGSCPPLLQQPQGRRASPQLVLRRLSTSAEGRVITSMCFRR